MLKLYSGLLKCALVVLLFPLMAVGQSGAFEDQLLPSDTADRFYNAHDIDGTTIVAGDFFDQQVGFHWGAVYVFEKDAGSFSWTETKKITDTEFSGSGSGIGHQVSLDGDTLAVTSAHGIIIYDRNTNWGKVKRIPKETNGNWGPGTVVDNLILRGDTLVRGFVGDDTNGADSGSALIYERNSGGSNNWGLVKKVYSDSPIANDNFGWAVTLSDDEQTLAVSAKASDGSLGGPGEVFIYSRNGGSWDLVKHISSSSTNPKHFLGMSLDIHGDRVAALGGDDDYAVQVYERNTCSSGSCGNNSWGLEKRVSIFPPAVFELYSVVFSSDGNHLLVGNPNDSATLPGDNFATSLVGSTSVYNRNLGGTNGWGYSHKVFPCDAGFDDRGSLKVKANGGTVVFGAINNVQVERGSVYAIDFLNTTCREGGCSFDNDTSFPATVVSNTAPAGTFEVDADAATSIENASTYDILNGAEVRWTAGNIVRLKPGFSADDGSLFKAAIDSQVCE